MVYNNRKIVEINEKNYIVEFMEKDTSVSDYIKWHNYSMVNRDDINDFYIIQIVQAKGKEPCFMCEYFNGVDGAGFHIGEWGYLEKLFYPDDAGKLKKLLIELSDKELELSFRKELGGKLK